MFLKKLNPFNKDKEEQKDKEKKDTKKDAKQELSKTQKEDPKSKR
jgi:hypothetical protein